MAEVAADSPSGSKKMELKICGVCGDKALGYNFNAVTCESCKAFFRRNALKKKEFKCPFNDNCKVDVVTRRFCQKCRLRKCFDIGMKKEWIMTDEEKKVKKQKIEENRQKRHVEIQKHPQLSPLPSTPTSIHLLSEDSKGAFSPPSLPALRQVCSPENGYGRSLGSVSSISLDSPSVSALDEPMSAKRMRLEELGVGDRHCITPKSELSEYDSLHSPPASVMSKEAFSPQPSPSAVSNSLSPPSPASNCASPVPTPSVCESSCSLTSSSACETSSKGNSLGCGTGSVASPPETMNSMLNMAIKAEIRGSANSGSSSRDLSELERAKLNELIVANKAMKSPIQDDPRVMSGVDPSLLSVINMTDIAIRRLIKMSKKINGFKNLCQEDQIALLKGGCTELMILRSVMTYNPEKDCWQGPKTLCIKLEVLREAKGNIYEEHKRFIHSFDPEWRMDENIMLILGAITLFNPQRPNVIHRDVIKVEQDSYYFLLSRYLESLYLGCKARSAYVELLQKMDELHILNENHVRVFLDVNPKDVEPLLIEIFDLKNH